jgi:hypothetical protein
MIQLVPAKFQNNVQCSRNGIRHEAGLWAINWNSIKASEEADSSYAIKRWQFARFHLQMAGKLDWENEIFKNVEEYSEASEIRKLVRSPYFV